MYEMIFTPRISEIDTNDKLKITAFLDYLQHIAYKHADQLGVGHRQIFHKGLTWLLLRYTVEISRYPTLDEKIKVTSWVAESNNPKYTLREFEVFDEKNEIICHATTSWLLFDYRKRKPVDFKDYWPNFSAETRRALNYDFPGIELPEKIDAKTELKVRKQDLDINQHVNHVAHIHWIMENLPAKVVEKYKFEKLEISYKEQGFHGDDILVETELQKSKDNTIKAIHLITKGKKKKTISKAITHWKLQK